MASASEPKEIPLDGIAESLEDGIAGLDTVRAAHLGELARLREVKREVLGRERDRLAAKLGADHPRVAALERRAEIDAALVRELRVEGARASVRPPKVDEKSSVLHGHVLDGDRRPFGDVTLALYLGEQWVQALGHACTDEAGYFLLGVTGVPTAQYRPLSLRVSRRGTIVHVVPDPVEVRPGTVEYREVVIRGVVCTPPEGGPGAKPPDAPPRTDAKDAGAPEGRAAGRDKRARPGGRRARKPKA